MARECEGMGVELRGACEYSFRGRGRQPSQARSARGTRRPGEAEGPNEQDRGRELVGREVSKGRGTPAAACMRARTRP